MASLQDFGPGHEVIDPWMKPSRGGGGGVSLLSGDLLEDSLPLPLPALACVQTLSLCLKVNN